MTQQQITKLTQLLIAYLERNQARKTRELGRFHDYELKTPLGILMVYLTGYNDLHCQFRDIKAALLTGLRINQFGKYNVIALGYTDAKKAFDEVYKPHLDRVMDVALRE